MSSPARRATSALLFTLLPVVCEALEVPEVAFEVPNVTLSNGAVLMGASHKEGTVSYWNIRYATADRFEKAAAWSPPPGTVVNGMGDDQTGCVQFQWGDGDAAEVVGVEDCLFLDVSAPADADGAAVMVWIHGGGLNSGSKNDFPHGMLNMVSEGGVIVVAINYRLGFFGFFTGSGPDAPPANNGIRDQIFALEWVRDNIAQFGGDASRVTIFGESAGALSVTVLHQSPLARGLFHRAIGMSPAWQNTAQFHHPSAVVAESLARQCLEKSGCGSIDCLKAKNVSEIALTCDAFFDFRKFIPVMGAYFTGFDGEVLEHSAYDKYCSGEHVASAEVPLMVGNLPHEWRFFEKISPARDSIHKFFAEYVPTYLDGDADTQECFREAVLSQYSNASAFSTCPDCNTFAGKEREVALATDIEVTLGAQLAASSVGGPRYRFLFDIEGDGSPMGSEHGADVAYMLGCLDNPTQVQEDLARMQREYFFTFARTGVPSSSIGPRWEPIRMGSFAVPLLHMRLGSNSSAMTFKPWFNKASADMLSKIACGDQDIPEFQLCLEGGNHTSPAPDPTPVTTHPPDTTPTLDPTAAPNTTAAPDTTQAPSPANTSTPTPSAGMQIQSTVSSLCVDLPGGDASNGALLWTWECDGGANQQWSFQNGQLVYLPDPSKCVDLLGGDSTNGNKLGIWDCYQGDSQLWGFDSKWGTIYLASSAASDATKCAQIGGENEGDPLVIWDCTIEPYQVWKVDALQSLLAVV